MKTLKYVKTNLKKLLLFPFFRVIALYILAASRILIKIQWTVLIGKILIGGRSIQFNRPVKLDGHEPKSVIQVKVDIQKVSNWAV